MAINVVDAATLHAASNDVSAAHAEMKSQLASMYAAVQRTEAGWRGASATSFRNVVNRWQTSSDKLLTAMENIGEMLRESGTQAQVLDEEEQATMNKFDGALNP